MEIRNIAVWGTVMEGQVLPAGRAERKASVEPPEGGRQRAFAEDTIRMC